MAIAATSWLTLVEAKRHLGMNTTDTSKDALVENLVDAACGAIERYIGRNVVKRNYQEVHDGRGFSFLHPRHPPAVVTKVYQDSLRVFGAATEIAAANYVVPLKDDGEGSGGYVVEFLAGFTLADERQNVRVDYAGGWTYTLTGVTVTADKVPPAIREAALLTLQQLWVLAGGGKAMLGMAAISAAQAGSASPISTIELSSALPQQARQLLDTFRWDRTEVL